MTRTGKRFCASVQSPVLCLSFCASKTQNPPKTRKPRTVKPTKSVVFASAKSKAVEKPTPLGPVFVDKTFAETKDVRKYVEGDGIVEKLIKDQGWLADSTVSFVTFRQIDGFSASVVTQKPKTVIG